MKFVEVVLDGWDTHQDNFNRTTKLMGTFDPAMATLIKELDERKMLDSTLILMMGEFGRRDQIDRMIGEREAESIAPEGGQA